MFFAKRSRDSCAEVNLVAEIITLIYLSSVVAQAQSVAVTMYLFAKL